MRVTYMSEKFITINCLAINPSLVDGPGYRTVLFLQGCDAQCQGCHNVSTWDLKGGQIVRIDTLVKEIRNVCLNKKLTISGGEPLLQEKALQTLLNKLKDFDICLYTGRNFEDVPINIIKYLKYLKVGRYIQNLKTTTTPYIGSTNQIFMEITKDGISKQKR